MPAFPPSCRRIQDPSTNGGSGQMTSLVQRTWAEVVELQEPWHDSAPLSALCREWQWPKQWLLLPHPSVSWTRAWSSTQCAREQESSLFLTEIWGLPVSASSSSKHQSTSLCAGVQCLLHVVRYREYLKNTSCSCQLTFVPFSPLAFWEQLPGCSFAHQKPE